MTWWRSWAVCAPCERGECPQSCATTSRHRHSDLTELSNRPPKDGNLPILHSRKRLVRAARLTGGSGTSVRAEPTVEQAHSQMHELIVDARRRPDDRECARVDESCQRLARRERRGTARPPLREARLVQAAQPLLRRAAREVGDEPARCLAQHVLPLRPRDRRQRQRELDQPPVEKGEPYVDRNTVRAGVERLEERLPM